MYYCSGGVINPWLSLATHIMCQIETKWAVNKRTSHFGKQVVSNGHYMSYTMADDRSKFRGQKRESSQRGIR